MDESLVLKQDQVEAFHIVSTTSYRKHKATSELQIYTIYNCQGPAGGCFGGIVHIINKTELVNGCKPSFEARLSQSISHCLQYIYN